MPLRLFDLPNEATALILAQVQKADLKTLRLTSHRLASFIGASQLFDHIVILPYKWHVKDCVKYMRKHHLIANSCRTLTYDARWAHRIKAVLNGFEASGSSSMDYHPASRAAGELYRLQSAEWTLDEHIKEEVKALEELLRLLPNAKVFCIWDWNNTTMNCPSYISRRFRDIATVSPGLTPGVPDEPWEYTDIEDHEDPDGLRLATHSLLRALKAAGVAGYEAVAMLKDFTKIGNDESELAGVD